MNTKAGLFFGSDRADDATGQAVPPTYVATWWKCSGAQCSLAYLGSDMARFGSPWIHTSITGLAVDGSRHRWRRQCANTNRGISPSGTHLRPPGVWFNPGRLA